MNFESFLPRRFVRSNPNAELARLKMQPQLNGKLQQVARQFFNQLQGLAPALKHDELAVFFHDNRRQFQVKFNTISVYGVEQATALAFLSADPKRGEQLWENAQSTQLKFDEATGALALELTGPRSTRVVRKPEDFDEFGITFEAKGEDAHLALHSSFENLLKELQPKVEQAAAARGTPLFAPNFSVLPPLARLIPRLEARNLSGDEAPVIAALQSLIPKTNEAGSAADTSTFTTWADHAIGNLGTTYIPNLVEAYLRLDPVEARTQPLDGGKTAQQLLLDRLADAQSHLREYQTTGTMSPREQFLIENRFVSQVLPSADESSLFR